MAITTTKIKCKFRKGDIPWHLVLKNVRERLVREKFQLEPRWCNGLCFEIEQALDFMAPSGQISRMQDWIMTLLEDHATVGSWLKDRIGYWPAKKDAHDWRILWLGRLIKEAEQQWGQYVAKETR